MEQLCSFTLPFTDVTVVYKATWLRSNKAKAGDIFLGLKTLSVPADV